MDHRDFARYIAILALICLGCPCGDAMACSLFPQTIYVGKAGDAQCNYNNIQNAIIASCPKDTIVISNEVDYGPQHLLISGKSISLLGSTAACGSINTSPTPKSVTTAPARIPLYANSDVDQAVVTITGNSHVTLSNFSISGGGIDSSTSEGGGIAFLNYGSLTLNNVEVHDNHANDGGGIAVIASGGHADLVIGANTAIHDNTAEYNGGGVYMDGDVHLTMVADQSAIYNNHAISDSSDTPGMGGGLFMQGGRADIGSPGISNGDSSVPQNAVIADNSAIFGGGLVVENTSESDGVAAVFTTDSSRPTTIYGNIATHSGGALFAYSPDAPNSSTHTAVCLFNTRIDRNQAQEDAIGEVTAAELYVNADPTGICATDSLRSMGSVDCGVNGGCNIFDSNSDSGYRLLDVFASNLVADRFAITGSTSGYAIATVSPLTLQPLPVRLSNCLFAGNNLYNLLAIQAIDVTVDGCTIAGNTFSSHGVFGFYSSSNAFNLTSSIVLGDSNDKTVALSYSNPTITANYNLLSDRTTVSGIGNFTADPIFVSPANGDYHLAPNSPAIDYAPYEEGHDLDDRTRDVDLPNLSNAFGPRDLGAYEVQLPCASQDTIFCDGFEAFQ